MTKKTMLLTGGMGFVGSHFVDWILNKTENNLIIVDNLNYSGSVKRFEYVSGSNSYKDRIKFLTWDLRIPAEPNLIEEMKAVTHVLHLAAESHVDKSIEDPLLFGMANVIGTINLLNVARKLPGLEQFFYFSTDEVFGPADMDYAWSFTEDCVHSPKNPYAASKSAAEQFVTAFANTYKLPCVITRSMNIFGEMQHKEKFIPLCIKRSISGEKVTIHGTPDKKRAGVRSYTYAPNIAKAYEWLIVNKPWGITNHDLTTNVPSYHIVGEKEVDNLSLYLTIYGLLKNKLGSNRNFPEPNYEIVDFHSSRPGHDLKYALNGGLLTMLGWTQPDTFEQSLERTVEWYLKNPQWL